MTEGSFFRLQQSEGEICHMAARLLSAFIASGQLTPDNENQLIDRSLNMAMKLALKTDQTIDSDDESGEK